MSLSFPVVFVQRMSRKYNENLAINTDCPKFSEDKKDTCMIYIQWKPKERLLLEASY